MICFSRRTDLNSGVSSCQDNHLTDIRHILAILGQKYFQDLYIRVDLVNGVGHQGS